MAQREAQTAAGPAAPFVYSAAPWRGPGGASLPARRRAAEPCRSPRPRPVHHALAVTGPRHGFVQASPAGARAPTSTAATPMRLYEERDICEGEGRPVASSMPDSTSRASMPALEYCVSLLQKGKCQRWICKMWSLCALCHQFVQQAVL